MRHNRLILLTIALGLSCLGHAQGHFTERDTIDVLHYDISLDMGHHQPRHIQGWCEVTLRIHRRPPTQTPRLSPRHGRNRLLATTFLIES